MKFIHSQITICLTPLCRIQQILRCSQHKNSKALFSLAQFFWSMQVTQLQSIFSTLTHTGSWWTENLKYDPFMNMDDLSLKYFFVQIKIHFFLTTCILKAKSTSAGFHFLINYGLLGWKKYLYWNGKYMGPYWSQLLDIWLSVSSFSNIFTQNCMIEFFLDLLKHHSVFHFNLCMTNNTSFLFLVFLMLV